jgi:DNA-binding MarR family transcriptional regulator
MTAVCRDAGLEPPILEEVGTRFRVTLRTERTRAPTVDPIERTILDLLADDEGHSTAEIASTIGLTTRTTRTRLRAMVERGLVREIGTSPQDPQRRYFRAVGR